MCLYVSRHHRAIYRAAYDILVYKRLSPTYTRIPEGLGRAPYQHMLYEEGKKYEAKFEILREYGDQATVHAGLHSYRKAPLDYSTREIFPAIIPKGARFIIGSRGDVVSTQLIVYKRTALIGVTVGKADFSKHRIVRKL